MLCDIPVLVIHLSRSATLTRGCVLPQYRVAIVIFTFCVTIVSTLYNTLGVNLYVQGNFKNIYDVFLETVISSIGFGIMLALVIMWYCRKHRILCY